MQTHSKYRFLSDLLDALAADGFPVGTGKHLQVQELLSKLPEDLPLASYKTILAPLFATNRQEQERFYELFDNALRREEILQKTIEESTPVTVPEEVKQVRRWRDVVLGLLIVLAGVAGFIFDAAVWSTWLLVGGVVAFGVYFALASLSKWDRRIFYWSLLLLAGVLGYFSKERAIEPMLPKTVYQSFPVTPGEAHHFPITFREDSVIAVTFANNSNRDTNEVLGIFQLDAPDSTCCFTYIAQDSFSRSLNDSILILSVYPNVTDTTYFIAQYQKPIETTPEVQEETNIAELDTLPIPYPRDISELYVDTKLEQRAAFYNQWAWLIKLALSLLFGFLLWAIVQWREHKRRRLVAELDRKDQPPYVWTLKLEHPEDIVYGEAIPLLLNQLRRRRFSEAFRLDVPRTVSATVRSAGRVAFQFRQMTSPPDYLLLIDRYNANDHRAALFNRLYEVFRANEVNIERFYYQGDPRLCFNEAYPNGIRLQELQHRFSDARLLLLGNGYDLLSPLSGKPAKWLSIFTHWRERALFTPQPLGNWGKREAALGDLFYLMPASMESFTATLEEFGSTDPRQPSELIAKLEDVPWRPIEIEGDLLNTLRQHYAEPLVQWIAACAVFPTLNWDLTLHLGRELSTEAEPLLTLDNLFALTRLPWFIEGRIPDAAREELIAYLQEIGLETRVRQSLHHLFEQALKPDPNSVAYEDYRVNALTNELLFTTSRSKRRQLQAELDRYVAAGTEPDVVSFKYLKERQRSAIDFVVPEQWKERIAKTNNGFWGMKDWKWALPLVLLLMAGIWIYQPNFGECKGQQLNYEGQLLCLESENDYLLFYEYLIRNNIKRQHLSNLDSLINETKFSFLTSPFLKSSTFSTSHPDSLASAQILNFYNDFSKDKNVSRFRDSVYAIELEEFLKSFPQYFLPFFANVSTYYYNAGVKLHNQWLPLQDSLQKEIIGANNIGFGPRAQQLQYLIDSLAAQSCANFTRGYALYQQLPDTTRARIREVGLSFELAMRRVCENTTTAQEISPATTTLTVFVTDAQTGKRITNAQVRALNGTITGKINRLGDYQLELPIELKNNFLEVEVAANNYQKYTMALLVGEKDISIALNPKFSTLNEINTQETISNLCHNCYVLEFTNDNEEKDQTTRLLTFDIESILSKYPGCRVLDKANLPEKIGNNNNTQQIIRELKSTPVSNVVLGRVSRDFNGNINLRLIFQDVQTARVKSNTVLISIDEYTDSEKRREKLTEFITSFLKTGQTTPRRYIEPEMILVRGGTFTMGCLDGRDQNCDDNEKPAHQVRVSDFYIGKYEVTFEEYDAFCEATNREKPNDEGWGRGKRPVINVSWEDATAYAQWLSKETGKNYRLPTEAEWEYAARGGANSRNYQYAGGNNLDEVAWYVGNSKNQSHPVGQKRANELGLHDMSGNVYEWCSDWYGDTYYAEKSKGILNNPTGPAKGNYRVVRGGSWYFIDFNCRVSCRVDHLAVNRFVNIGFRLAGY